MKTHLYIGEMFWQSYKSAAAGVLGGDMHSLCRPHCTSTNQFVFAAFRTHHGSLQTIAGRVLRTSLHTCRPQESGARSPEPLTQPDKLYFDIHVQRADALVIAAVQLQ